MKQITIMVQVVYLPPPSLPCAFWAFSLIRSNGTKLSLRVEWTMRIDEPAILTSVKVITFAKDFGIF